MSAPLYVQDKVTELYLYRLIDKVVQSVDGAAKLEDQLTPFERMIKRQEKQAIANRTENVTINDSDFYISPRDLAKLKAKCEICKSSVAAIRFAVHLRRCMGFGRTQERRKLN